MREPQRKAALIGPGGGAHLDWLGQRLRYLVVGEQTGRRVTVSVVSAAPGGGPPALIRRNEHVGLYVLSGELTASAGNRTLTLPAGSFLNIAPEVAYKFVASGVGPAEMLVVAAPAGFDEFQFRTGYPLARPEEAAPSVSGDDRRILAEVAPTYGIDPHPPAAAFGTDPRIRLTLPDEGTRLAVVGDLYRFLAVAEDTDGRYAIWEATIPPGGGPPLHSHSREDEAFYVLDGTVTFYADGQSAQLGPGGFAHLPTGIPHRFANETDEPATMLILVAPAGLEKMFERTGRAWQDPTQPPGPPDRAEIERLIQAAPEFGIELYLDEPDGT
jgi:quercetin dioxygenase-like cupin family protein